MSVQNLVSLFLSRHRRELKTHFMKLRLRKNSIRLRLLQSEVSELEETGIVSEEIQFGKSQFLSYTLRVIKEAKEISAEFEDGEIFVEIPLGMARSWTETNLISLESEQAIDENSTLKITIEKDFACPDRPFDTDNADAFTNPKMTC